MRRWRALAVVLALTGIWVTGPAAVGQSTAAAAPFDCKDAPTPDMPGNGPAYWFVNPPQQTPPVADPFAPDATTTVYEQYGFSGLIFTTYDYGCSPGAGTLDSAVNSIANMAFQFPIMVTAVTTSVQNAAFHPQGLFAPFDSTLGTASATLKERVFDRFSVIFLALLGLLLIWRARKRDIAGSMVLVLTAVGIVALVSMLATYPVQSGRAADSAVSNTVGYVSAGFAGSDTSEDGAVSAAGNLHRSLLYEAWLTGTFGRSGSDMARKYGPELFKTQALTWTEARLDPDARKKIIEDKKSDYEDVMGKIKDEDPSTYEYVQGKKPTARLAAAVISGFGTVLVCSFIFVAAFLMLVAFMIVRIGVMLAPVIGTVAVHPLLFGHARAVGEGIWTAVLGCVMFGIGAALNVMLVGVIMSPQASSLSPFTKVVILTVLSVVFFFILRPFARFHKAFERSFRRAGKGLGAYSKDLRDTLKDTESAADRRAADRKVYDRNAEAERAHAAASLPGSGTWSTTGHRPEGASTESTRWGRPVAGGDAPFGGWAPKPPPASRRGGAIEGTRRAITAAAVTVATGGTSAAASAAAAKAAKDTPRRPDAEPAPAPDPVEPGVPLTPDAIFRPTASRDRGDRTLPTGATEPQIIDGEAVYRIYRPAETGRNLRPEGTPNA